MGSTRIDHQRPLFQLRTVNQIELKVLEKDALGTKQSRKTLLALH